MLILLFPENVVVKTDIWQTLQTVCKKYSFSICAVDSRIFKEMLLDSDIAKSYKQQQK